MTQYTEDSIQQLSGLEHIRLRPSGYINDTDVAGQLHCIKELVDNSIDEIALKPNGSGKVTVILFINDDKTSYQVAVVDNGRGIPVGKLIDVYSNTMTSGKFDTSTYQNSIGSYGVGATVSVALSTWFRAITFNVDIIGDVSLHHDNVPTEIDTIVNRFNRTGTIAFFEPDQTIFSNIPSFANDFTILNEYLIRLCLFNDYHVNLIHIQHAIPKEIRTSSTEQMIEYIDNICSSIAPIVDSRDPSFDRELYFNQFFGMTKQWDIIYPINGTNIDHTLKVKGSIYLTLSNIQSTNNKFTMVNNTMFTDSASYHITILNKILKEKLGVFIQDRAMKTYFIDHYRLPIWLALDIKYAGAVFVGLAKTSFKDSSFRHPYRMLMSIILNQPMIEDLYNRISEHIVLQYNRFNNSEFRPTSMKGLLARLNRPDKFNNCSTSDRSIAELFLVEGDSAKKNQGRDSTFQAMYTLGGKPFNGLTDIEHLNDAANAIKKNHIFQDIIRILNITPGSSDLSNLNFGKTFIMADADTHGYHITNIVLGNIYAICPALIEQGHMYITIPPLFSMKSKGNSPIYIKDVTELNFTLANCVYYKCIELTIQSNIYNKVLTREEFVTFCDIVIRISDELERLSTEYMIPAPLLEQLALYTNYLDLKRPNIEALRDMLGCEIRYVEAGHMLIVSIGTDDIVVPLNQITELIYQRILPMYREFYYGKTRIFATTKNSTALQNAPISITQLNEIFKRLNSMFTIERYKGLGSMESEDRVYNCIAPSTRRVFQITSLGDIDVIFQMLGSDASVRKQLVLS